MTPYEKLKSLEKAKEYLKPEFSFEKLDKTAYEKSDSEFAEEMNKEKKKISKKITKDDIYEKMRKDENNKNKLNLINPKS